METQEVKLPSHLSNIYKKMVVDGLIVDKKYVGEIPLADYLKSVESSDSTEENPPTTTEEKEPSIPLSEVQKMMEKMKSDILANLPQQTNAQQNSPSPQIFMQPTAYDIDDDIDELKDWEVKDREYRLMDGKRPISHSIQRAHSATSAMQYFNKRTGKTHTMRWSTNQPSFFVENQSKNAADILDAEIVFEFGTLKVYQNNPNLQKFLRIHPLNGILFKEYDAVQESRKNVVDKKTKAKAYSLVETIGSATNRAICSLINPTYIDAWDYGLVEEAIYNYAESNPKEYIAYCEDPTVKIKGVAKTALAKGEIVYKNYKFYDKDGAVILETDRNKNEMDEIASYFQSGAGRQLYEYLLNLS